eukprot:5566789-Ditylum_brightwellii.AAC.1
MGEGTHSEIGQGSEKTGTTNRTKYKKVVDVKKHATILRGDLIDVALTKLQIELAAVKTKLQKRKQLDKKNKSNKLFQNSHKNFYSLIRTSQHVVTSLSIKEALEKFWGGLLGKPSEHNVQAKWLEVEKESVAHVQETTWIEVTSTEFETVVKSLKIWKAPGPDKVHNYWCKHLPLLHDRLRQGANHALCHPELLPRWMTG